MDWDTAQNLIGNVFSVERYCQHESGHMCCHVSQRVYSPDISRLSAFADSWSRVFSSAYFKKSRVVSGADTDI
jgi:hypothetical protein